MCNKCEYWDGKGVDRGNEETGLKSWKKRDLVPRTMEEITIPIKGKVNGTGFPDTQK